MQPGEVVALSAIAEVRTPCLPRLQSGSMYRLKFGHLTMRLTFARLLRSR